MASDVFSLVSEHLPAGVRVLSFRGQEAISRLYRFEILFVVPHAESADFELTAALLQPGTLNIHREDGSRRAWWHGVFASVEHLNDYADDTLYRAVLVPRLFLLSLARRHRAWVKDTAPDKIPEIIQAVVREHGIDEVEAPLQRSYRQMLQVVQYAETDLDFIARWMEREGLYFYFTQGEDKETFVFTDSKDRHPNERAQVRYYPTADTDQGQAESMEVFRARTAATPLIAQARDYDDQQVEVQWGAMPVSAFGKGTMAQWGEGITSDESGERAAGIRGGEAYSRAVRFHGRGRLFDLRPGYYFDLEDHPRGAYNTRFLCVELEHEGNQFAAFPAIAKALGLSAPRTYKVELQAVEGRVQFRAPRRTPTPRVYGVETAFVDGPADSAYAQIDEQGRYRVKMHFDEGPLADGKASLWVRMLQPHGGDHEGFHFPLRKGTEVMLVFLGGDPDRPVIAGTAPNPKTPSPVTSDNHTQNVVQTGGLNRIEMEDLDGAQYIDISTPPKKTHIHLGAHHGAHKHNWIVKTDGNGLVHTGGDEDVFVGGKLTEHAVGLVTETYDDNHDTTVALDQTTTIGLNQTNTIGLDQTNTIGLNQTTTVGLDQTTTIGANQNNTIGASQNNKIAGDQTSLIGGSQMQMIGSNQVTLLGGNQVSLIGGSQTQLVGGGHTSIFSGGGTVISPPGYTIIAPGGYKVVGASWFKTAAYSGEAIGAKISFYGAKTDIGGIKMDLCVAKIDMYATKADCAGFKASPIGVWIKTNGLAIGARGLNLIKAGLSLFT